MILEVEILTSKRCVIKHPITFYAAMKHPNSLLLIFFQELTLI